MSNQLHIEYMPLSALKKYSKNPKDHDLGLLHSSFARFGFNDPMAIDESSGTLVEGHGRLDGLITQRMAGEPPPEHIDARPDDWYAPVIRGVSFDDPHEMIAYLITHNRTTEAGGWFPELLTEQLQELAKADVSFEGTGYDLDDLDAMIADMTFEPSAPAPEPPKALNDATKPETFGVIVRCKDAEEESAILHFLDLHGYAATALSQGRNDGRHDADEEE